jgi:NADH-quinone oxidoreductase subunit M
MPLLLNLMLFTPALGAILCLCGSKQGAKWTALATSLITLGMSIVIATEYYTTGASGVKFVTTESWISSLNVNYKIGVDGLSLPLILLTTGLSVLVVLASFSIERSIKAFMALYLLLYSGILGVFLSLDMFLFYVFFEVSLLPMYFLIGIWGGPRKEYAAIKFFLYTLVGSVALLIVMFGFYYTTSHATGSTGAVWTIVGNDGDPLTLQSKAIRGLYVRGGEYWNFAQWAFWLTLIAFMIKLPGVPFHTWLPDAHVEAPTPISMILAGVLLKMGGYALMRITYPIFPEAAQLFWIPVATLGVIAIIYGAMCAMAQTDWKKLVAYSSVSHMGYVTLGLAVLTSTGFNGAYYQMIGHGISSAMMFYVVGVVYERAHHRDMNKLGGLWNTFPGYGGLSLVCFLAGMGLPGLCGFIGEVMVVLGVFQAGADSGIGASSKCVVYTLGTISASGVILTAGYILWMFQRVFMGRQRPEYAHFEPIKPREYFILGTLGIASVVFGLFPILVFNLTDPTVNKILGIFGIFIKA